MAAKRYGVFVLCLATGCAAICSAHHILLRGAAPDLALELEYRSDPPSLTARFVNVGEREVALDLTGLYAFTRPSRKLRNTALLHLKNDLSGSPARHEATMPPLAVMEIDSLLPQLGRIGSGEVTLVAEYEMSEALGRERGVWHGTVRSAPLRLVIRSGSETKPR